MEKREGPLTFNELKKELKDYSEFNFLKYGNTQSGGALTLKKFREMLVQLRIVKGQNANSIYTEKEFEEMGYDIPKDAIPFYNGKGEKCYDVAYAPNTSKGIGNLQFEDTFCESVFSFLHLACCHSQRLLSKFSLFFHYILA